MADQFRADHLGCLGATHVRTPHLDRLAAAGMVFTQCCTNAPICAPARIGLATANQPLRHGALDNQAILPLRQPTYYQRLRDHGYRVGCVGKLDLAKPLAQLGRTGDRPLVFAWGFTHPHECEGKVHAGSYDEPVGPYGVWLAEQNLFNRFRADYRRRIETDLLWESAHDSVLPARAYEDAYIGQRAVEWLETVGDDFPWHYFVSFVGPHDPFDPPTEYAARYRQTAMPPPVPPGEAAAVKYAGESRASLEQTLVCRRQYAATIELIDEQIGKILGVLESRGLRENTVVVFTSDHGEMLGDHGLWTKNVFHEGALRVPLIVAGPGIPAGHRCDALVELIDLNPTLCDWAGTPRLENTDAVSLVPLIRGEVEAIHQETISSLRSGLCVRTRDWKLIVGATGELELYDLAHDPGEQTNLASRARDIAAQLRRRLSGRLTEAGPWR